MAEENKVKAINDAEVAEETAEKKAESATETKKVSEKKAQSAKDGKSKKGKKNSKKDQSKSLKGVFRGLKTEFSKITWPSRNEITKETITVLIVSVILGLCIFGLDKLIVFVLVNLLKIS